METRSQKDKKNSVEVGNKRKSQEQNIDSILYPIEMKKSKVQHATFSEKEKKWLAFKSFKAYVECVLAKPKLDELIALSLGLDKSKADSFYVQGVVHECLCASMNGEWNQIKRTYSDEVYKTLARYERLNQDAEDIMDKETKGWKQQEIDEFEQFCEDYAMTALNNLAQGLQSTETQAEDILKWREYKEQLTAPKKIPFAENLMEELRTLGTLGTTDEEIAKNTLAFIKKK